MWGAVVSWRLMATTLTVVRKRNKLWRRTSASVPILCGNRMVALKGRADDYWQQALHQHLRERAYVLWQQEGSPEGRADENWNRLGEFGAQ